MARAADFGLMIWDGKSAGTILNVLRLVRSGKKAVLINVPEKSTITFKAAKDWDAFLSRCSSELAERSQGTATLGGVGAVHATAIRPPRRAADRTIASGCVRRQD